MKKKKKEKEKRDKIHGVKHLQKGENKLHENRKNMQKETFLTFSRQKDITKHFRIVPF